MAELSINPLVTLALAADVAVLAAAGELPGEGGAPDFAALLLAQLGDRGAGLPAADATLLALNAADAADAESAAANAPGLDDAALSALASLLPFLPAMTAAPVQTLPAEGVPAASAPAASVAVLQAALKAMPAQTGGESAQFTARAEASAPAALLAGTALPAAETAGADRLALAVEEAGAQLAKAAAEVEHQPPQAPTLAAQSAAGTHRSAPAHIEQAVGTPGWGQEVAQKLVWMAARDQGRAELSLNPPHLGKLEVVVTVQGSDASALFVSASAQVRDSLEQALPRLREVLAEAGINLGRADVSADSPGGEHGDGSGRRRAAWAGTPEAVPLASHWLRGGEGLVDTFA